MMQWVAWEEWISPYVNTSFWNFYIQLLLLVRFNGLVIVFCRNLVAWEAWVAWVMMQWVMTSRRVMMKVTKP